MSKILLIENYGMLNYLITEVRFDCKTIKRGNHIQDIFNMK